MILIVYVLWIFSKKLDNLDDNFSQRIKLAKKKIDPDLIFDKCIESLTQRPLKEAWHEIIGWTWKMKRVKEVQKSRQSNHFTLSFIFILLLEYFMAASSPAPPSSHYKVDARSLFF